MAKAKWLLIFLFAVSLINYPNPFNPKGGEIATFECSAEASSSAVLYIYDMAARLILRKDFPLTAGITNRTTWNGYSDFHALVGNGVYLYQLRDGSSRLGKGKIWVINK